MPLVATGEGAWLTTADGARILDAISSWWVITHDHCHPRIVAAIREQAGARGVFNAAYEPLLFEVDRLPFPRGGGEETLAALERLAPDTAALIVEPLLLGAGGMLTYAPETLAAMKQICQKHGALFIADE